MSDSPKYTELALLILPIEKPDHYSSSPSSTWKMQFITVEPEKQCPRNISDSFDHALPLRGYQDLEIRTYLWGDNPNGFVSDLKYSEIYSANLRDLERRYKTLSALERKHQKVVEKYGSPQTLGEYVGQIMLAAGIKQSFEALPDGQRSSYDDSKWRRRDVAGTRSHIMQMRYQWFETNGTKKEADAA